MSINNSALTVLILSCDRYSDLWDGHVKMLRKHWTGRCEKAVGKATMTLRYLKQE